MQISRKGIKLLAEWEGVRNTVYNDVAGLPTIGIGHLLTQDEIDTGEINIRNQSVAYGQGLSDQQVLDLLTQDLERFEKAVQGAVERPLSQNQFDALVCFAFNIGIQAFIKSTLVKVLNQGRYDEVPTQLRRWVKAGGQTVQGLVNRREKEIKLWNDLY